MQSRFQSSLQSGLQSDYAKSTSSFFSSILTTTTSKYNTLKRQLISSEADGDTEDDSHIARGLRAYYTEKGKQFPEWLPPDPKAPPPPPPTQFVSSSVAAQQQGYGQQPGPGGRFGRAGGGLSDLWGDSNRNSAPAAGNDSLRPQRPGMVSANSSGPITTQAGRFGNSRFGGGDGGAQLEPPRPLPSQRAGSYQSQQSGGYSAAGGASRFDTSSPPPSSGSGTAQDRLKARLWGAGRTASPPPSNTSSTSVASSGSGGRNPYENMGSGGSGGRNPYADQGGGSSRFGGGGGGGGGAPQQRPMVSANSPWSDGGGEYGGGGGGYDQGGGRSGGLPSGPRAGRQGLPSGPRPQRF